MSRLPQTIARLAGGQVSGELESFIPGTRSGGRTQKTYAAAETVYFFTVPDGPKNLQKKPDIGYQITVNAHFYFIDAAFPIKDQDRLTYGNFRYTLTGTEPRSHGEFTYAYGIAINRAAIGMESES